MEKEKLREENKIIDEKIKTFVFNISGKLETENREGAIDLIYEMLNEQTQFQIELLEEEDGN